MITMAVSLQIPLNDVRITVYVPLWLNDISGLVEVDTLPFVNEGLEEPPLKLVQLYEDAPKLVLVNTMVKGG